MTTIRTASGAFPLTLPERLASSMQVCCSLPGLPGHLVDAFAGREPEKTIDTAMLAPELSGKLLEAFDDRLDGYLLNGDNESVISDLLPAGRRSFRLIYLDPPYNTGNTNQIYQDSFEREEWLTRMRATLTGARELLREDGSICVSIDDAELPYMRILMDEIFSAKSFVACIAYERSGSAGLGQSGVILNTKEYVLLYCMDRSSLNDIGTETPLGHEVMKRYNKILLDPGTRELVEEFQSLRSKNAVRLYRHREPSIETISLRDFKRRQDEIRDRYLCHHERIFRTQNVQRENTFQMEIISRLDKKELYSVDYVPARGRYRGKKKTLYYRNGELCAWLKDSSAIKSGTIMKRNKLTDMWRHGDIPKADLANEGGVNFKRSKKPEHLLFRLISITTDAGDLVGDFFLGSGTTTAVAHKMGRRWVGIESEPYFEEYPLVRMRNVLAGEQSGVSRLTGWQGGGAFGYVRKGF